MPRSSTWSLALSFSDQNFVCISQLSHVWYMTHPSHSPWFYHPNNILWRVQDMKFFTLQFSSACCHFFPLRSKSLQHPILNTINLCFSLGVREQVSHLYRITGKITVWIF
jgi:hypothetical protein